MSRLRVENLAKSFGGVHALRGVSFELAEGELLAMIGPNGAGKTTCFNAIAGVFAPDSGRIFFEDREITNRKPHQICALGIGRTFQVAATFASMTVEENLRVVGGDVEKLLEQVQLRPLSGRISAELAYGDLKRVELAIALASAPRLLLMDEPTAGMAAAERRALMDLVRRISKERGISVLFTEHDMDVVFGYADRVIVLSEGELIAQGAPEEVRSDARVRRVYLGEEDAHA
jgi:ABC-type branched-subunit amino acid transport system ATPase component